MQFFSMQNCAPFRLAPLLQCEHPQKQVQQTMNIMKNRKLPQTQPTPRILALVGVILLGGSLAASLAQQMPKSSVGSSAHSQFQMSQPQHQQQVLQLEQKYQTVNQRITTAEEKAAKNSTVKKERVAYMNALYKKMAKSAPDMKKQIDQFQQLGKELQNNKDLRKATFKPSKSLDQKLSKYQHLSAQLGPIMQQAASDPHVAKLRSAYVHELLAQMRKTEPQINSLLQQRQQLVQSIHSMQSHRVTMPSYGSQSPSKQSHNPPRTWNEHSASHSK